MRNYLLTLLTGGFRSVMVFPLDRLRFVGAAGLYRRIRQLTAAVMIQSVCRSSPKVKVCSPVRLKPMAW